jgi:hypothetical protein
METEKLVCIVCGREIPCDVGRRYFLTGNGIYEPVCSPCIGTWISLNR